MVEQAPGAAWDRKIIRPPITAKAQINISIGNRIPLRDSGLKFFSRFFMILALILLLLILMTWLDDRRFSLRR